MHKPRVTVRLDNIAANYLRAVDQLDQARSGAVVKANGYGLGAFAVAKALHRRGCKTFFVARLDEGIDLSEAFDDLVEPAERPTIIVFDGVIEGTSAELAARGLVPAINSLDQLSTWSAQADRSGRELPAVIHLDTGMLRLGLGRREQESLLAELELRLTGIRVDGIMSHLASADVDGSPQSAGQLDWFDQISATVADGLVALGRPRPWRSLSNSAGVFLGPAYHFDLTRPGVCLYGGSPHPDSPRPNPMETGVVIEAPIVQIRRAEAGETVGYGATHRFDQPSTVATIPVGYADGFVRSMSGRGLVSIDGRPAPVVGRVSMDLITIDVTSVEPSMAQPGRTVELVGPNRPIDEVAEAAGTIPHEFLTRLSRRFDWVYHDLEPTATVTP